jgi:predicted ribosome quality control (RQC) complex YloA/Tae2 family protein
MSMHQHYHVIKQLSNALAKHLNEATLIQAHTFSKNEAVLYFTLNDSTSFCISMQIVFSKCFLIFDEKQYSPRSNAQPLFEELMGQKVLNVNMHPFNRSFQIVFEKGIMVFKMYDGLANLLFYTNGAELPDSLFRDDIQNDKQVKLASFFEIDEARKQQLTELKLEEGIFSIVKDSKLPYALLAEHSAGATNTSSNIFEAYNQFSRNNLSALQLHSRKHILCASLRQQLNQTQKSIMLSENRLREMENEVPPEEIGHILMANLHEIKNGITEISLFDFYRNHPIIIKLKKDLNAQENATFYYRKSKNRQLEKNELTQRIEKAKTKLSQLQNELESITQATQLRQLKDSEKKETKEVFPFRVFSKNDFQIWVGKSAANNDLLTLKYAHKNDMWLHAKDVAGSHVVIKHKAGKTFTKEILEYAGALAAYYSKLKGSNLVPVAYTLKKFVRKPKGFEPGQVMVEKEEVMLVKPELS